MNTLIAAASVLSLVLCAEGCNIDGFQTCLLDFEDKHPETSSAYSVKYDREHLDRICADLNIASVCVQPRLYGCSFEVKGIWQVLNNSMTYLCSGPSKAMVERNIECMSGKPLENGMKLCNSTFTSAANRIKNYGGTASDLCQAMKSFGRCAVDCATTSCNKEVGEWYSGLVDAALQPAKDAIRCYFTAGVSRRRFNAIALHKRYFNKQVL